MFSVPHLIIIFVVALVVFGPEKLPELARTLGKVMGEFRRATGDLRSTFEGHMRDLEREADQRRVPAPSSNSSSASSSASVASAPAVADAPAPGPYPTPSESEPVMTPAENTILARPPHVPAPSESAEAESGSASAAEPGPEAASESAAAAAPEPDSAHPSTSEKTEPHHGGPSPA